METEARFGTPLFIIKDKSPTDKDVDSWAINEVYPLRAALLSALSGTCDTSDVRLLFCSGKHFVFYTVWTNIFNDAPELCHVLWYGNEDYTHCVGICKDTDSLIDYLVSRKRI